MMKKNKDNAPANLTAQQKRRCRWIIHSASAAAGAVGAGLAQLPGSDNAILTPLQLSMAIGLGETLGVYLNHSTAAAAVASASASVVGRTVSQVAVGWIPGYGNAINAATAASLTEAIGWMLVNDFAG